jgi:hypothetical protein
MRGGVENRRAVCPMRRAVLERIVAVCLEHHRPARRHAVWCRADLDEGLQPLLGPAVGVGVDEVVGPASTHRAAVLPLEANADDSVGIVCVVDLAALARDVVAEAPARAVAIRALRVEPRALRLAVVVAGSAEDFEEFVVLHAFAPVWTGEQLFGARYRVEEGMWRQAVVRGADTEPAHTQRETQTASTHVKVVRHTLTVASKSRSQSLAVRIRIRIRIRIQSL